MTRRFHYAALAAAFILSACGAKMEVPAYDRAQAVETIKLLSADDMQGRRTNTAGQEKAALYIMDRMKADDLLVQRQVQNFSFKTHTGDIIVGQNIVGRIPGRTPGQGPVIVLTAHYDHVGMNESGIFNGADDNASGVAALLATAQSFRNSPPEHDIIFAFLDAEERVSAKDAGLRGAEAFIATPGNEKDRIALNINLDMVSRTDGTIFVAGTYHFPSLKPIVSKAVKGAALEVKFGHDLPDTGPNDWTLQSDHAKFFQAGIPFLYFGVEDHPDYHRPTDTFDKITPEDFLAAVDAIIATTHAIDAQLSDLTIAPRQP